jgi:hypothetical protein
MKRVMNRYGKITLASLGGCLVSIGTFLIVLSSLTVTEIARADDCVHFSSNPGYPWGCVPHYVGGGLGGELDYWCCNYIGPCTDSSCNDTCDTSGACMEPFSCRQGSVNECRNCQCKDKDPGSGYDCKCE